MPNGPVFLNGYRITGLAYPVDSIDAASKQYVDDKFVAVGGIPTKI